MPSLIPALSVIHVPDRGPIFLVPLVAADFSYEQLGRIILVGMLLLLISILANSDITSNDKKKKKNQQPKNKKNDHLSPVSAPGTERKPSLRLSISLCSSASQCNVNTKPQNTHSFPRKRQIDDINTNKDQLCSISPPWTTPRVTNVQFAVYATRCFVISSWTVLSLRHDETAFLLTHLTIIMKTLRIIWCTELRALAEMLHHAVHEAPVLGIENRR